MLKFIGAVMAAAAFATLLSATSARRVASPFAKPEQASLKPTPSELGPNVSYVTTWATTAPTYTADVH